LKQWFVRRGATAVALSIVALGYCTNTSAASAAQPHLSITTSLVTFGTTTLGDYSTSSFSLTNQGPSSDTIDLATEATFSGAIPNDYFAAPGSDCPGNGTSTIVLGPGSSCSVDLYFYPSGLGERDANLSIRGSADSSSGAVSLSLQGAGAVGYYGVDTHGYVSGLGDANVYRAPALSLNAPIVGMASTGNDLGYWLVAADGGIFSYGDAQFYGSTGSIRLNKPIVGMTPTRDGRGYWFVASDGGIFAYGDAQFYGSRGGQPLNAPIVGMAVTPDGGGYWLVATDGGIFSYGDARFYGSTGSIHLNQPIVGMATTPDGGGYWFDASDGGIFSYGDARFYGSTGSIHLNQPIVGMATTPDGGGYWFDASDGGIFSYGDAQFFGARGGQNGSAPIVGMAAMPGGGGYWVIAANGVVGMYGDAPALGWATDFNPIVGMAVDGGPVLQQSLGITVLRSDFAAGVHPGQQSPPH
jgi:hypothetical protein